MVTTSTRHPSCSWLSQTTLRGHASSAPMQERVSAEHKADASVDAAGKIFCTNFKANACTMPVLDIPVSTRTELPTRSQLPHDWTARWQQAQRAGDGMLLEVAAVPRYESDSKRHPFPCLCCKIERQMERCKRNAVL
jgi:hypothetical protein